MGWLAYAILSAVAAAATAILAKAGVQAIPSNLATGIRTVVILILILGVMTIRGELRGWPGVSSRAVWLLALSGVATGVSWLAYFRALQLGPASLVAPIDKLSLPLTVVLAALVLGEPVSGRTWLGVAFMVIGAALTWRPS